MGDHRVVGAILRRGDGVLLCHRSPERVWFPDVWDVPGGHVDPGEDGPTALRRELAEELGIMVPELEEDPRWRRIYVDDGVDLSLWVVDRWEGEVVNRQPEEHDAIGWFGLDDLGSLELADPGYLALLRDVLVDPVA